MAAIDDTKFALSKAANRSIERGINFNCSMADYLTHTKLPTIDLK